MKRWTGLAAALALAALASPVLAQTGSKADVEARIQKLEAELKNAQEKLQALQQRAGKEKQDAKEFGKKEDMKKAFEKFKSDPDFQKKFEDMKKAWAGKDGKGKGKGFGGPPFGKGGFGPFGGMPGGFKKFDFKKGEKPEFQKGEKPEFKRPDFKKGEKPEFKRADKEKKPFGRPEAKDAGTEQLLRQILEELRDIRKELSGGKGPGKGPKGFGGR
jgi:hypothetical protein